MDFLTNKFFLIAATFMFYLGAQVLQRKTGLTLLNPILLAIASLIIFLTLFDIDFETYQAGESTSTFGLSLLLLHWVFHYTGNFPQLRSNFYLF